MIQSGDRAGFALEAFTELFVRGLDGDDASPAASTNQNVGCSSQPGRTIQSITYELFRSGATRLVATGPGPRISSDFDSNRPLRAGQNVCIGLDGKGHLGVPRRFVMYRALTP